MHGTFIRLWYFPRSVKNVLRLSLWLLFLFNQSSKLYSRTMLTRRVILSPPRLIRICFNQVFLHWKPRKNVWNYIHKVTDTHVSGPAGHIGMCIASCKGRIFRVSIQWGLDGKWGHSLSTSSIGHLRKEAVDAFLRPGRQHLTGGTSIQMK